MNAQQVIAALRDPQVVLTDTDIKEAWDVLRVRHGQLGQLAATQYRVGDQVEFNSKKGLKAGKVTKINPKTIEVMVMERRLFGGNSSDFPVYWKVAPQLLRKVS